MHTLLIRAFFLILFSTAFSSYGQSTIASVQKLDSLKALVHQQSIASARVDSALFSRSHRFESEVGGLHRELDSLKYVTFQNSIAKDFFASQVAILISAFIVVVTLAIFVAGLLTYRNLQAEFKRQLRKQKDQFEQLEKKFEEKHSQIANAFVLSDIRTDKLIYMFDIYSKHYSAAFISALQIARLYFRIDEIEDTKQWLNRARDILDQGVSRDDLIRDQNEVGSTLKQIKQTRDVDLQQIVDSVETEFSRKMTHRT